MNEDLISLPSALEIKEAMFAIHADKPPGPDGFSASFFPSNWEIVGPSIVQEIQYFFSSGTLPASMNTTHIKLIPKTPRAKTVAEYRPIALCNVFYKTISKLLAIRIKPILGEIIPENQSAFVAERTIADNVLLHMKCYTT